VRYGGRPIRLGRLRASIIALTVLAGLALAAQAQAATYTVGTTSDTTPGASCTPSSSTCSLRQLIEYENGLPPNPSPADTINVPAGSYSLINGALTITQSLSIVGAGARTTTVAGNSTDQVFYIKPPQSGSPPTVMISGLYVTGGNADFTTCWGGDIRNDQGTLTLSEDVITGGQACSGGGIGNVGGNLTVTHSLITGNTANSGGADSGGIQTYGDPNVGAATLEVDNSTISNNTSHLGGGIFSWCDNGGANGGACSSTGAINKTTIVNSTIAYNDGGTRSTTGGGLLLGSMTSGAPEGSISVQNSIVVFNTVDNPGNGTPNNCGASITSLGYNLENHTDCGFTNTGDLQSKSPEFTSLSPQDNGGNTDTFGVVLESPVVDHVPAGATGCSGTKGTSPGPRAPAAISGHTSTPSRPRARNSRARFCSATARLHLAAPRSTGGTGHHHPGPTMGR
jgi:hypothetical protein